MTRYQSRRRREQRIERAITLIVCALSLAAAALLGNAWSAQAVM